jgi:hypothetical protein
MHDARAVPGIEQCSAQTLVHASSDMLFYNDLSRWNLLTFPITWLRENQFVSCDATAKIPQWLQCWCTNARQHVLFWKHKIAQTHTVPPVVLKQRAKENGTFKPSLYLSQQRCSCVHNCSKHRTVNACGHSLAGIVGRVSPEAWMFVCCECCVLSGRGLCVVSVVCCQVEDCVL